MASSSALHFAAAVVSLLSLLCHGNEVKAKRILMIGAISNSHLNPLVLIGNELIKKGHDVYITLPSSFNLPPSLKKSNVKKILWTPSEKDFYEPSGNMSFSEEYDFVSDIIGDRYGDHVWLFRDKENVDMDVVNCRNAFNDEEFMSRIRDIHFDFAIIDGFISNRCFYALLYKYSIPYMSTISGGEPWHPRLPYIPSFVPNYYTSLTEKMTTLQKIENLIAYVTWSLPIFPHVNNDSFVSIYVPEKPFITLDELYAKSQLWFMAGSPQPMAYPRPAMPHVVDIAGLNAKPAKPLPKDLLDFMEIEGKNGVVVVSFGSIITKLPDRVLNPLLQAFLAIDQAVIFRYSSKIDIELPSRIKVMKWLPQNDILGHENTKVFITHCGQNGQVEALYHAVPIIGLPVWADQLYNCKRIDYKGFGMCMDLRFLKAEELAGNINKIVFTKTYSETIKQASLIFKDRQNSPLDTAVFWVEHVLKFGGKHLRSHMLDMPWYELYMIDIAGYFLALALCSIVILFMTFQIICTHCRRQDKQKVKSN